MSKRWRPPSFFVQAAIPANAPAAINGIGSPRLLVTSSATAPVTNAASGTSASWSAVAQTNGGELTRARPPRRARERSTWRSAATTIATAQAPKRMPTRAGTAADSPPAILYPRVINRGSNKG